MATPLNLNTTGSEGETPVARGGGMVEKMVGCAMSIGIPSTVEKIKSRGVRNLRKSARRE